MITLDDNPEAQDDTTQRTLSITMDRDPLMPANIKVLGIGGGGGNAVNRMIDARLRGIEFMACNTDLQALARCNAPKKLQLGRQITPGPWCRSGSSYRPRVGTRGHPGTAGVP